MNRPALIMSEASLMEAIRGLCKHYRLLAFHCYDARKSWSPGYPDLTIIGPGGLIFRECKTEHHGATTPLQDQWACALQEAKQDWAIWRPGDLASGRIKRELERLAKP